ncbi:MAG: hypothetical protein RIB71_17350 [Imperialibacter sp.]|uniref:transporter n=1 Tax=Imperialibacter sp. TaxID=2038411 RepID=UPI0032EF5E00
MKRIGITVLFLYTLGSQIQAQTEQQILPSELKKQTLITQPATLYKGFFRTGLSGSYIFLNKVFNADSKRESISNFFGYGYTITASVQYGVTDRIQVELAVPFSTQTNYLSFLALFPGDNAEIQRTYKNKGSGLGDTYLSGSYQLIAGNGTKPALVARVTAFLPTGEKNPSNIVSENEYELPIGSGNFATELSLMLRQINYPFLFTSWISYKHKFPGNKIAYPFEPASDFHNGGLFNVSGSAGFHVNEWMAVLNDLDFDLIGRDKVEDVYVDTEAKWALVYRPHISFQVNQIRINQALSFPLFGKMSGADPSYLIIVQYVF